MAFINLNKDNPFAQYRIANYDKSWPDMARLTGINLQILLRIVKETAKQVSVRRIEFATKLFESTGIDLVAYATGGKYHIAKSK